MTSHDYSNLLGSDPHTAPTHRAHAPPPHLTPVLSVFIAVASADSYGGRDEVSFRTAVLARGLCASGGARRDSESKSSDVDHHRPSINVNPRALGRAMHPDGSLSPPHRERVNGKSRHRHPCPHHTFHTRQRRSPVHHSLPWSSLNSLRIDICPVLKFWFLSCTVTVMDADDVGSDEITVRRGLR